MPYTTLTPSGLSFKPSIKKLVYLSFLIVLCSLFSCKRAIVLAYSKKFDKFHGEEFPRIPLTDVNGNTVPFDTLKGKVTYMDTWFVGCGPCYVEFNYIDSVKPYFANRMDSVRFVNVCTTPPKSHQEWLDMIKEKKITGDNYYISDSVYKIHKKQIERYFTQAPTFLLLSPDAKIMGYDVDGYSYEISAVYLISESIKGKKPSTAYKYLTRQLLRSGRKKPMSASFREWFVSTYHAKAEIIIHE